MMPEQTWFGQPRGLTVLFLTNMWEQFSYYGMRALLVYYMTKQLLLGQAHASFIYGTYTAGAYFTPILGGLIADRLLGKRRAIVLGGAIMCAGHFMMTFEPLFYAALATIAIGNGLFLPCLPSQVGDLYKPDDQRRGWAYNVYYVGINIGGFLAPLICGTLGEVYGWHYGFGVAGIGMGLGLVIYLSGQRHLPPERKPARATETRPLAFDPKVAAVLLGIGLAVTLFRSAYEQVGNTVALWADSGIDRSAGSLAIPMTWFQSLNPLFVMLLTPPLLHFWRRRAEAAGDTAPLHRMAMGALIVAGAYAMLATIAWTTGPARANWMWLAAFFLIFTFGELFILPTGLGLFARLAPLSLGATTVAAWFFITFTGSLSAGMVGTLWSRLAPAPFFLVLAGLACLSALLLRLLSAPTETIEQRTAQNVHKSAEMD
ncbi:peptide MFS transporter [Novosphingobium sp. NBM11]|uniref:peptide MFS transporter n=1 Tax=Novosphingobium sp. NBM11 TaxID=2596914 RepID=UPI0018921450|nr:peptide MFS transporter [Novosphingobium sp. NBM11]MBF5092999.1 peptide MFS transporter [Novosphingobium sp. NBM11]